MPGGSKSKHEGKQIKRSDKDVTVLFEYQGHRCALKCKRSGLQDKVEEVLISLQASLPGSSTQSAVSRRIEVHTLQSTRKPGGAARTKGENTIYLLQRYVEDWKVFVNVDSVAQIRNKDVITVTVKPSLSVGPSHRGHSNAAESVPRSLKEECSTSKRSLGQTNKRDSAVSVIALKKLTKRVPKNEARRKLISENRMKTLYFYRDDDEIHVDSTFKKEFGLTKYVILDSDQSGRLFESTLKTMNGSQAID